MWFLNLFRIIVPIGRIILKEWILTESLLNYRSHGKRSLGRPLKRWSETITGYLG
jgi:hypothetical protein